MAEHRRLPRAAGALSRRSFCMAAVAAVPVLKGPAPAARGIEIGVQSFSFRDMLGQPGDIIDNMIAGMQAVGLDLIELRELTILPYDLVQASVSSPEMRAAIYGRPTAGEPTEAQKALRAKIRAWRLQTPLSHFTAIRRRFEEAGIRIQSYNFTLKEYCTEEEVERSFAVTRALGTDVMNASTTLRMAKRCVPFAEQSRVRLGLHGHTSVDDPNEFASPQSFERGLELSPLYRVNLDIGHFSAAGFDPVAFIKSLHDRVVSIHVKDRKNHNGPFTAFGVGDTPIIPVLRLIREQGWPIPAMIEYEHEGGPSVPAVRSCLAYMRAGLE